MKQQLTPEEQELYRKYQRIFELIAGGLLVKYETALTLLRELEWSTYDSGCPEVACGICGGINPAEGGNGHAPDCRLNKEIGVRS